MLGLSQAIMSKLEGFESQISQLASSKSLDAPLACRTSFQPFACPGEVAPAEVAPAEVAPIEVAPVEVAVLEPPAEDDDE